jgi:hypothetical protein
VLAANDHLHLPLAALIRETLRSGQAPSRTAPPQAKAEQRRTTTR